MKPSINGTSRGKRSAALQGEGSNWVLIAGGALLSTLSVRLGYKLKQILDAKQQSVTGNTSKGNDKPAERRKARNCNLQSSTYNFTQADDNCYNFLSGTGNMMDMKQQCGGQVLTETGLQLPLVTVPSSLELSKDLNGGAWSTTTSDPLELPQKPFHHSNSSESPCVSESGSDIFSKREVIQKLRQQLKRRDEMILEMQEQIVELQGSLTAQLSHSSHLQTLLDVANSDLFDAEREMQRLRKVIADRCVRQVDSFGHFEGGRNGYGNGHFVEAERYLMKSSENGGRGGDGERIEMLKVEVAELKETIERKEYRLHIYEEQKAELSAQVKQLQQRLDSQLPSIL